MGASCDDMRSGRGAMDRGWTELGKPARLHHRFLQAGWYRLWIWPLTDEDISVQEEACNVALTVVQAVRRICAGMLVPPGCATEAAAAEASVAWSAAVAQCSIFET